MKRDKNKEISELRRSVFKIALQKNGALSKFSCKYISKILNIDSKKYEQKGRKLFGICNTRFGKIAIYYLKNYDLLMSVEKGFVDMAIVGSDKLAESKPAKSIKVIKNITSERWPVYYAYPIDRRSTIKNAKVIATLFPKTTKKLLEKMGRNGVGIVKVNGSTEITPYLSGKTEIDGIIDIVLTGETIKDNGLKTNGSPLLFFRPMLIANNKSLSENVKIPFFKMFS